MKKIILPLLCIISISLLSGCSLPGEKGDKTEVVIDSSNPDATTDKNIETNVPTDTTPSDTPKAIAEGGLYLPYTTTAVAQAQ